MIYKCINKLICEKLKVVLPGLISYNQGAFVENKSILHNVLLCPDVVKMYNDKQSRSVVS